MLFTRKGDTGTTKLFSSDVRIPKGDPRIQALGDVDELNSWLGFCAALVPEHERELRRLLRMVQEDLFVIQAMLAGAAKELRGERLVYLEAVVADVEGEIEPIRSFTVPGATVVSGALDVARTIARRAERSIVALGEDSRGIVPYLNRLSSALFALARLAAHRAGVKEEAPRY